MVCILLIFFIFSSTLSANLYYVAPDGTDTNPGTREAPLSLYKVNYTVQPGDTVVLLDGTYQGRSISPKASGEKDKPIVYRAENRQKAFFEDTKKMQIARGPVGIFVSGRSYIIIDGIKVKGIGRRWIVGEQCDHITIMNSYFENSTEWINAYFSYLGDGISIINNYFNEGTDLLSLEGGDYHLVEGNFFGDASHTGLVLLGVRYSVVRNNTLTNRKWRSMEVLSERISPYRTSMYNLLENNLFDYSPVKCIQYAGNRSILRRNIFINSMKGMNWTNYIGSAKTPEAWHDESNRFYNNLITNCGNNDIVYQIIQENADQGIYVGGSLRDDGFGMTFTTNMFNPPVPGYDNCAYGDNIVVNNIFYLNSHTINYSGKSASATAQIAFDWNATPADGRFHYNNIYSGEQGAEVFFFHDAMYERPIEPCNRSIASFQNRYPEWATNNIEADPLFVDPDQRDFHLKDNSPCIDKGGALTKASISGNGTVIEVDDVLFFTDGHGIIDPDILRIGTEQATIVQVIYDENKIVLNREISWEKGTPVTLDYKGTAPDIGIYEYGEDTHIQRKPINNPVIYSLHNFPNPFNMSTTIQFEILQASRVKLEIFNIKGQKIITLINEDYQAGVHRINWNGREQNNRQVNSGIYFYKLTNDKQVLIEKMLLVK
jgi:hypothetical protein